MNVLLHGWQSVPGGTKPTFLAQHVHKVFYPKLADGDFEEAMGIAQTADDRNSPGVVVGSSQGGAAAMKISSGDAKLVLFCPPGRSMGLPGR
jgi:hypothetical protein